MVRVGLDYTSALRQVAGIGRYTRSLVAAMLEQSHLLEANDLELVFFYAGGQLSTRQLSNLYSLERQHPPRTSYVRLPFSEPTLTRMWQRLRLPIPLELVARLDFTTFYPFPNPLGKLNVVHSPDFALPPRLRGEGLVTIHDLSFLVVPECAESGLRTYLTATVPRAVAKADKIVAVSEHTKRDLINLLNVPENKIEVVYNGVDKVFQPIDDIAFLEDVRHRLELPDHFVLFVGTIEPRKNLTRLIEAWQQVKQTEAGRKRKLVLAGRRGWLYEPIFQRVTDLGLRDDVVWLDFVPDGDLPALYNLADCFAFPSIYEGFGIPPLEALACGTPVVTADNSALPEIFNDVALLVKAEDTAAIANAIVKILEEKDNQGQLIEEFRVKGMERAAKFTWERAARQMLDIYKQMGQK